MSFSHQKTDSGDCTTVATHPTTTLLQQFIKKKINISQQTHPPPLHNMATMSMLGGRVPPNDDQGLAHTKTRAGMKRCATPSEGTPAQTPQQSPPWEREGSPPSRGKQGTATAVTPIRSPEAQGKRTHPALAGSSKPPWNQSSRVNTRRKTYDDTREGGVIRGAAWRPPGEAPKMRAIDTNGREGMPWEKDEHHVEGRINGDPFQRAGTRNKSCRVLLHEGMTDTPADAGRRTFYQPTSMNDTSMIGDASGSYSHSVMGDHNRAEPVSKSHIKIRQESPAPPPSATRQGGKVHLIAKDSEEQKHAGRNTNSSLGNQTHAHIWGRQASPLVPQTTGRKASTPRSRQPAPWERPGTAPFSMSREPSPAHGGGVRSGSAGGAPWDRTDGRPRSGVSTNARDSVMMKRAWNPDVSNATASVSASSMPRAGRASSSAPQGYGGNVASTPVRSASSGTIKHF